MEWIQHYVIFALSGSLVTWIQIYRPSIHLVRGADPDHVMCRHPFMGAAVWLTTAFVFIPILAIPLLSPEVRNNFIYNLTEGFLRK